MEHLNLISALLRSAVDLAAGPLAHSQPPQLGGFFIVHRSRERYVCFLERKIHVSKTQTDACKNIHRAISHTMDNAIPAFQAIGTNFPPLQKLIQKSLISKRRLGILLRICLRTGVQLCFATLSKNELQ